MNLGVRGAPAWPARLMVSELEILASTSGEAVLGVSGSSSATGGFSESSRRGGAGPAYNSQSGSADRSWRRVKQYSPTRKGTSKGRGTSRPDGGPSSKTGLSSRPQAVAATTAPALQAADFVGEARPRSAALRNTRRGRSGPKSREAPRRESGPIHDPGCGGKWIPASWDRLLPEPYPTRVGLPTVDEQIRSAGQPAVPGSTQALAEIATAGSSTVQCTTDHRLKPRAAPIKP